MAKIFAVLVLALALAGGAIWYFDLPLLPNGNGGRKDQEPVVAKEAELGGPLYPPAPFPAIAPQRKQTIAPLAVVGHLAVLDEVELPSQVPGQILYIGEPVPEGAVQTAGLASFLAEPFHYANIWLGEKQVTRVYRRLYRGQEVRQDQQLGALDDAKAIGAVREKQAKVEASLAEARAGVAVAEEGERKYAQERTLLA